MSKQPFYHYVDGLMFTCTEPLTKEEFFDGIYRGFKKYGIVKDSIDTDSEDGYKEPEAGDPNDL